MTEAEARERIAQILSGVSCKNIKANLPCDYLLHDSPMCHECQVEQILALIKQAGYRPMPELKVLTPEERSQIIQRDTTLWCPTKGEFLDEVGMVVAQAQLEADKKAMEEAK